MPISTTMVPPSPARCVCSFSVSGAWPETTVNMWLTSRCVTGIPAAAGTEMALVTPEITRTGTPAFTQEATSSPPRPNTYGSPPLSRTTFFPASAASTMSSSMPAWLTLWWPGRLPTSTSSAVLRAGSSWYGASRS